MQASVLNVRKTFTYYSNLSCISQHRLCDTTALVRNTPETFKGLRLSQRSAFCPQKALLAGIIHLNFCNNIFAEKHIVGSSESAIIFSNVRMDCSTKTSEFKQKEAALTFTLSSS